MRQTGTPVAPEVVAAGIVRPLQLVADRGRLVVLSPGAGGDTAGEIHWLALPAGPGPGLTPLQRLRIPFTDARTATLGSLAVHPASGDLFLGEENGQRVWRLRGGVLEPYAAGLRELAGGSTLAFDALGRLVLLDYADRHRPDAEEAVPGLEQLREEDYRGPIVVRLTLDEDLPRPRRVDRLAPLVPRGWRRGAGPPLPRLIAVAALGGGDLALLASTGELFRLRDDGVPVPFGRLPPGQYHRTHMVAAPDGTLFVSGGFHVGRVFRVAPDGTVAVLAANLADPEGVALGPGADLYVAESALHRIVRLRLRAGP